jgi:hypothetical protein
VIERGSIGEPTGEIYDFISIYHCTGLKNGNENNPSKDPSHGNQ